MIGRRWLGVLAVLVAGCSGAGTHSAAAGAHAAAAQAPKAAGWQRTDLKPLTSPQLAGGRLVLYVQGGGGIQVVGLDPKTGKTVWRDDASPGDTTSGVAPVLGVAGSTVVFFSPVDNATRESQLVGVDGATGRRRWSTTTAAFEDWPGPCPDAPADICTAGTFGYAQDTLALRFRASDGAQVGAARISQSVGGREIGPDLYDPGVRDPEELVAVSGSRVAWTEPLSSVFPAHGASTDHGWDFTRVPAAGLFVGMAGAQPLTDTGTAETLSIADDITAGFRISDGKVAWQVPGTLYACGAPLPCPGQGNSGQPPTSGLRLLVTGTGTVSIPRSDPIPKLSPGDAVVVEGFDLATGKTRWTFDAGADGALLNQTPPFLGPEVAVVPSASGGLAALNLATGKHKPVTPGALGWCLAGTVYKTQVPYPDGRGGTTYNRAAWPGYRPCDPLGVTLLTPARVPGFVGTSVDGLTVWSNPSEVAAVPASS